MSAIYYKGKKYTGPTLNLGSGSLTTDDKTIVGGINEINSLYKVLQINVASFSSLPQTVSNNAITSDHVVVNSVLGTPTAQTGEWTVTASDGSLTISGSINGSTTLILILAVKQ